MIDYAGNTYSTTILTDPYFEKRLKAFDKNLRLVFDQNKKRWTVLEKLQDNSGWRVLLRCENEFGEALPVGDWVIHELGKMRLNWESAISNPNEWFSKLISESDAQKKQISDKASINHKAMLMEDIVSWRKAAREIQNLPSSDVTAGYRKLR